MMHMHFYRSIIIVMNIANTKIMKTKFRMFRLFRKFRRHFLYPVYGECSRTRKIMKTKVSNASIASNVSIASSQLFVILFRHPAFLFIFHLLHPFHLLGIFQLLFVINHPSFFFRFLFQLIQFISRGVRTPVLAQSTRHKCRYSSIFFFNSFNLFNASIGVNFSTSSFFSSSTI